MWVPALSVMREVWCSLFLPVQQGQHVEDQTHSKSMIVSILPFVAVFWRDTSAGMPTLPYYLAKVLADIPRIAVACKNLDQLPSILRP